MRKPSRQSDNDLGLGGNKLSAFLHGISNRKRDELNRFIKEVFSTSFESIETITTLSDHKRLFIEEKLANNRCMKTEASHIRRGIKGARLEFYANISSCRAAHEYTLTVYRYTLSNADITENCRYDVWCRQNNPNLAPLINYTMTF
jgi:hypothetical protein